jgi:hypothetical protein
VLEVIRQRVSYLSGGAEGALNLLLEAIKFAFTGETPVQGRGCAGEHFWRFQLYAAELRALGEVMLLPPTDKPSVSGDGLENGCRTIGYAHFLELICATDSDIAAMSSEARRLEARRFQAAFAKLKADVVAVAARPEARPMRRLNMLRVLLMRLIDELDPPARGATALERDAIAEEEARWRTDGLFTAAEGGGGGGGGGVAHAAAPAPALVAVSPPGSPAQGGARRGVKRARAEDGAAAASAAAAAAARLPLPALLLVPIDSLPFAPTPSAPLASSSPPPPPLRLSKAATRMEIIPRDEFRWHPQYDATVADAAQAGNAAQRKFLRDLYAAMHRTKARGRAGEQRRLLAMLELGALESLQRGIAAADMGTTTGDDGGAADGVIARALPPALRGDGRAVAAVRARLALLSRSRQLLRAEHVALQLDSLERTEALEM